MDRIIKTGGVRLLTFAFIFILSVVAFSLFYAHPASAWTIGNRYTVYKNSGNWLYWNGKNGQYEIIDWTPRIDVTKVGCNDSPAGGHREFDVFDNYTNCDGLKIQELTPGSTNWVHAADNNAWFEQANYTYELGDVDWSEVVKVGGGTITNHGVSTKDTTNSGHVITAKSGHVFPIGDGKTIDCDDPNNPDPPVHNCSILFKSDYSDITDFHIFFSASSSYHEFAYAGLIKDKYRTLRFDPNGGSFTNTDGGDGVALLLHKPSPTSLIALREYVKGDTAIKFPKPTRIGYAFNWWCTSSGGCEEKDKVSSRPMDNDETLYADWDISQGYQLTPTVNVDPSAIEAGEALNVTAQVNNEGLDASDLTSWSLSRKVNGGTPTDVKTDGGTKVVFQNGGPNAFPAAYYTDNSTASLNPGDQVCFILTLTPYKNPAPAPPATNSISAQDCAYVGKKPKTQIWGGDLLVRGDVTTSKSVKNNITYGSWAEYGIIASGGISGAASGAAFAGPGLTGATTCKSSPLSFTSAGSSSCAGSTAIGNYSNTTTIPDVAASFPVTISSPTAPSDLTTASGVYKAVTGNQITGGNIDKGKWVVINAPNDSIKITGNINYYGGSDLKSIYDVPQVVVIAKDIDIADTVTNIDAWLVTPNGSINTCASVAGAALAVNANLSTGICDKQLLVNGPVMADKLYLRRTAGSDASDLGKAAETFNLRADAYLWATAHASIKGNVQTNYITELPPRF